LGLSRPATPPACAKLIKQMAVALAPPSSVIPRRLRHRLRHNGSTALLRNAVAAPVAVLIAVAAACACGYLGQASSRRLACRAVDCFASPVLRPRSAARRAPAAEPDTAASPTDASEDAEISEANNATVFNLTLLLGSGFPDRNERPGVNHGPPWVTCHVQYVDKSGRDEHGSVMRRTVLEEWVMKGSDDNIGAFRAWRQQTLEAAASVRCTPIQKALEDIQCLVCVPRGGSSLPFSPVGRLHATEQRSQALDTSTSYVLTIDGVDQCLAGSLASGSFCKSGSLAVAV